MSVYAHTQAYVNSRRCARVSNIKNVHSCVNARANMRVCMYLNSHLTGELPWPPARVSSVCPLAMAPDVGVALTENGSGRRQVLGNMDLGCG